MFTVIQGKEEKHEIWHGSQHCIFAFATGDLEKEIFIDQNLLDV